MLFDLPDDDVLYEALLARDAAYDGRAYVGVTSTGVFCRLTCPTRKPKRENCVFFCSVGGAMDHGFRACARCKPLESAAAANPMVLDLLARLKADPGRRWSETDVARLHDPSTVRRVFRRHFGITFLDLARRMRLKYGAESLANDARVINAQLDSGFQSASGFREAFTRLIGIAPASLQPDAHLKVDWVETPLGPMMMVADARALYLLEFLDRKALPAELKSLIQGAGGAIGFGRTEPMVQLQAELAAYFKGASSIFTVPLEPGGTPFARKVWRSLQQIPAGETRSYSGLAKECGTPEAVRAVARANGANRLSILVPCHRVIGADGALTSYGGGLWRKQALLAHERTYFSGDNDDQGRCFFRTAQMRQSADPL